MLEAHNDWNLQASQSLDRVMLERGYITQAEHSAIEKEVESTWQSYRGECATLTEEDSDLERSAPLLSDTVAVQPSTISTKRSESELQEEKEALISATIDHASSQPAISFSGEKNRIAGNRYQIIRPHARGGLGEVSVAEDKELRRKVALKEIQARFAQDRDSKTRFVQEAEVTGRLEHPGIVPVYGFGEFADGRPYYAMRFIEGESLKDAADIWHDRYQSNGESHSRKTTNPSTSLPADYFGLEFRGLLGRLIDVAQAIEYAHSRGVLHRDIKPSNIMLGKYGETLVVDWGLAKVRGLPGQDPHGLSNAPADQAGTVPVLSMTGAALGTPSFMPPEQASGDWEKVGPASDVYALGGTLYYLLTGQAPIKAENLRELLEKVIRGEVSAPGRLRPGIPKPLEAICLKAMALKPEERYRTPQDFAADLERFLADEATAAYEEPRWLRAKRWARKHPKFIAALTATIFAGLISAVSIAWIVNQKNEQLNQSLVREINLKTEAVEAQERAEQNQEVAENQSRLALNTLSAIVYDLQGGLEDIPGGGEIRRRLLLTALENLGGISEQYIEKSIVDVNSYQALTDMGDVVLRFGSGDVPFSEVLGPESSGENKSLLEVAGKFFERALQIAQQIAEEQPDAIGNDQRLVIALDNVGKIRWRRGENAAALALFERSNQIAEDYVRANPDDYRGLNTLGITLERLFVLYSKLAETSKANAALQRKLEIDLQLTQQQPNDLKLKRDLSITYGDLAQFYRSQGELKKAEEYIRFAVQTSELLAESQPESVMAKRDLASRLLAQGQLYELQSDIDGARRLFERSQGLLEELLAKDPSDRLTTSELARLNGALAYLEMDQMRFSEAIKYTRRRIDLQREIAVANQDDMLAQKEYVRAANSAIGNYVQLGEWELTRNLVAEQADFVDSILKRYPEDDAVRFIWADSRLNAGKALLSTEDLEKAEVYLENAEQVLERLKEEKADEEKVLETYANLQMQRAQLFEQTNRLNKAQAAIEVAIENFERLKEGQDFVGLCLETAARISMAQQNFAGAEKLLLRKQEVDGNLLSQKPQIFYHWHNQTVTFYSLSQVYLNQGQREKGIEMLDRTLASRRELAEREPSYVKTLSKTFNAVGKDFWILGDLEKARKLLDEGLQLQTTIDNPHLKADPRDILFSFENLGLVCVQDGNPESAIEYFRRGIDLCEGVLKQKAEDAEWLNHISLFWRRIGDTYQQMNDWNQAESAFTQAVEVLQASHAGNARRESELASSYERLAALNNVQRKSEEALKYAALALEIRKKIQVEDSRDILNLRNLLFLHRQIGDAYQKSDRWDEAILSFEEGRKLCGDIEQLGLVYERLQDDLESFVAEVKYTQDLKIALGDWEALQGLPEPRLLEMIAVRSYEWSLRGKYSLSVEAAMALIGKNAATSTQLFDAAYDVCVAIKKREAEPALFAEGDSSGTLEEWRLSAMTGLQKAVEHGYMDWETLRSEPVLEPLRSLPAFEKLFP
jgi:serine/threonine protein kinase